MKDQTTQVLAEVAAERERQDAKWGEQNHPDGTGPALLAAARWAADRAKTDCQQAAQAGSVTWRHVLWEEVAEAMAEDDLERLRVELVQVAAVAVAWVEAIDRRRAAQQTEVEA